MSCRVGFVWESKQHFNRYLEDCGLSCELVTPYVLAAPFFRGTFHSIIIPTGFANPAYSNLLPALRASSPRIRRFVENGGNLLVFGAAIDREDSYDWLPFPARYRHEVRPRPVACPAGNKTAALIEDYDAGCIECDGSFTEHGAECIGESNGAAVIIEKREGKGRIVVTTVHEYPSRKFLHDFCTGGTPTLF
jgi:hypothetical protein